MGKARPPQKVKLVAGLLASDTALFARAAALLERALRNKVDFESRVADFSHTDYYAEEMGPGLKRRFISFEKVVDPADLYKVKLVTNRLERRLSSGGKRKINIDPGYLDLSKLVLFSTKDYSHRIYLRKGVYAEVTLFYRDHAFNPWPWTYPDYKTPEYKEIFDGIRNTYKKQTGHI